MDQPGMQVAPIGLGQTVVIWLWTHFQMCVQVTATVLCSDGAVAASSVALNAVSAALLCSDIPWEGPLAAVQIAHNASDDDAGQTFIQPTSEQLLGCGLTGIYMGTADAALLADFQVTVLDACLQKMLLFQDCNLLMLQTHLRFLRFVCFHSCM